MNGRGKPEERMDLWTRPGSKRFNRWRFGDVSLDHYFTTSSCSERILLIVDSYVDEVNAIIV